MTTQRRAGRRWIGEAALGVVLLAAGLLTWDYVSPRSSPFNFVLLRRTLPAVPRPQRPQTLDPALFTGEAAEAYRVAREHPEVLERVACYCGCYTSDGHQNSLDCFQDRHAESRPMCLRIAIRAGQLAERGYAAEDIQRRIDREFAPREE
jgi:hypothetical protein